MSPLHVRAQSGEVAPFVLLPGDPGRAQYIADTFLEDVTTYNTYRSLLGFTGTYKGLPVSVQTTGMGCPTASIVAEELIQLGARVLVRVGTSGAVDPALRPADLLVVQGAVPLDGTTRQYLEGRPYAPIPSWPVLKALAQAAEASGEPHHVGLIATEDAFYATNPENAREWHRYGVMAFEMEAAAIFLIAKMRGVHAGALLTVSNQIGDTEFVEESLLQRGVHRMIETALEGLLLLEGKV
ncbi:purine-nucleoside phosphorylase [Oceanithermus sp.]|uniref:phosphorylase family protein n=1 Tax=Oceanithermus sp. TaxID=2268145 RepID=UPI0025EE7CE9|nr:purine-nucleoside phosphorylase [Oceanithermus sp.]